MLREGLIDASGRLDSSYGEYLVHATGTFDSFFWRLDSLYGMLRRDLTHATERPDSYYEEA